MVELRPDVEALGGTSVVTVDSDDETVLYFIETFPDQAAMDADMKRRSYKPSLPIRVS